LGQSGNVHAEDCQGREPGTRPEYQSRQKMAFIGD